MSSRCAMSVISLMVQISSKKALHSSLSLKARAFENQRSLGKTCVLFEAKQAGVGGINSWGRIPMDAYLIKAQPYGKAYYSRSVNTPLYDKLYREVSKRI